jgi:hypothetical protein
MPDETDSPDRPLMAGTIGIRIRVIEYNGATGIYRTVKDETFKPSTALLPVERSLLGRGRRGREDKNLEPSGD